MKKIVYFVSILFKNSILFATSIIFLLAGCKTTKYRLTPCFYEVKQSDSVWVDQHSIRLYNNTRTLVVAQLDTTSNIPQTDNTNAPATHNSGCARSGSYLRDSGGNYSSSYHHYKWNENVSDLFFNSIVARRATENLNRTTPTTLIESETPITNKKEVETISQPYDAQLVIVLRDIKFRFKSQYEDSHYEVPPLLLDGVSPSVINSFSGATMVYYQSVWDLYWIEDSRVTSQRSIILQSSHWVKKRMSSPLESVFGCALKVGDDFVNLFK